MITELIVTIDAITDKKHKIIKPRQIKKVDLLICWLLTKIFKIDMFIGGY